MREEIERGIEIIRCQPFDKECHVEITTVTKYDENSFPEHVTYEYKCPDVTECEECRGCLFNNDRPPIDPEMARCEGH